MASKPGSFLINLKLRKSSNVEEIHDIVLGEVIRASSATTERDRTKIIGNGDSSIVRNLRVNSTSVKSVAVSPPFIGIVLDNGKACRYKITERSDVFTDRSVGSKNDSTESAQHGQNSNLRNSYQLGGNILPSTLLDGNSSKTVNTEDNGIPLELDFPEECSVAPKRQRVENASERNMFSVPSEPEFEESFEERRFNELIQLGLAEGRNREQDAETQSSTSMDRQDPFFAPILDESGTSLISGMGFSGVLIGGSTIPDSMQREEPGPSDMITDDPSDVQVSSNPSIVPAIQSAEAMEEGSSYPPTNLLPSDSTILMQDPKGSGSFQSNSSSLWDGEQTLKICHEYRESFQSMFDKVSFMQHQPSSSSSTVHPHGRKRTGDESMFQKVFESEEPLQDSDAESFEWMQTDLKGAQFDSITALHSEFLLVTKNGGKLWTWPLPRHSRTKADFNARPCPYAEFLGLAKEEIRLIHSDLIRVTLVTESGKICSFFDSFLSGSLLDQAPNLVKRLTLPATSFPELQGENIIDLKSRSFYSAALTLSGKVFWWGLSPDHLRRTPRSKKQSSKQHNDIVFQIGDCVALKERKEELGSIVMKNLFTNGPMIGRVVKIYEHEKGNDSHERKHYTVELIENGVDGKDYREESTSEAAVWIAKEASRQRERKKVDWSSEEVIFLEERAITVGAIVGLDGNFVVVSPHSKSEGHGEAKKLKVCLKTSLTKVSDSRDTKIGGSREFLVNEDRYTHAIRERPTCVVNPSGSQQHYGGFKAVAIAATKYGLAMLLNRLSDRRAFLVQPEGVKEDNSKVFTCSTTTHRVEKEILVSDSNVTSEFESVSAAECMLDVSATNVPSDVETKQVSQRRHDGDVIKSPHLLNVNAHGSLILLDSNACLFPVRFGSCLRQTGTPEGLPFRIFDIVEANYGDEDNEEMSLTIVAVQESLELAPAIIESDIKAFENVMEKIETALESRTKNDHGSESVACPSIVGSEKVLNWLSEKCCGNQNVLHLCAGHLTPTTGDVRAYFDAGSDALNEDGAYMLRRLLDCKAIRNEVAEMLREKDSLGCTPFLSAVWRKNFNAAILILRKVLELGQNSGHSLFKEAVCVKSATGMTALHHMVFHTSGLQPNLILQNAVIVSNLPSNYSPRMLLQLFKERFASAYRACIPVPTEKWVVKCAGEETQAEDKPQVETIGPPMTQVRGPHFIPTYQSATLPAAPQTRVRYDILNRADALRATARQGLVMFSDIAEMNQALAEMDRHPLICRDELGPAGLTSVARYTIHVHRADDRNQTNSSNHSRGDDVTRSRPTRHIIHPALQASPIRLPRGHLFSDPFLSRSVLYGRHLLPQAIHGSRVCLPREMANSEPASVSQANHVTSSEGGSQRNQTTDGNTETKYFIILLRELFECCPEVSFLVNDQEETALAYYLNNAKRLTPFAVYDIFGKWIGCGSSECGTEVIIKNLEANRGASRVDKDARKDASGRSVKANGDVSEMNVGDERDVSGMKTAESESGSDLNTSREGDSSADANGSESGRSGFVPVARPSNRSLEGSGEEGMALTESCSLSNVNSILQSAGVLSRNGCIACAEEPRISSGGDGGKDLKGAMKSREEPQRETRKRRSVLQGNNADSFSAVSSVNLAPINGGPIIPPSQQQPDFPNTNPMMTILDSTPPQGLPSVTIQPVAAGQINGHYERTLADVERLASMDSDAVRGACGGDGKRPGVIARAYETKGNDSTVSAGASPAICICPIAELSKINRGNLKKLLSILPTLLHSKASLLGTIFGNPYEGPLCTPCKASQQGRDNNSLPYKISIEKLDAVVGSLMLNPVPFASRYLVRTLLQTLSTPNASKNSEILRSYFNYTPNPELDLLRMISDHSGSGEAVEVAATYRRFLGSVVRQLSFCLSKDDNVDPKYCHKIGRYAKVKVKNDDERTMESIRSTLRSFSWLSVIEVLKAAETTIRPVRLGIAKAQPRGIMSGLQGIGERPPSSQNAHLMHSILGTNTRIAGSSRRAPESFRSSPHIKVASRKPSNTQPSIQPTRLIRSKSNDDDPFHLSRDFISAAAAGARDSGHVGTNLQNGQDSMPPLAWTLDGHIRVSDIPRSRSLPIPDFLEKRPDPDTVPSIHAGNCYLAQMFSRLVKEAVDLANDIMENSNPKYCTKSDIPMLYVPKSIEEELMEHGRKILSKTWEWLVEVMNSIEEQLRTGEEFDTQRFAARSMRLDPAMSDVSSIGRQPTFSQSYVSKPEEYLIYLLKSGNEDAVNEIFPILDLVSYSHITFVLDAYFYMLKKWPFGHLGRIENPRSNIDVKINVTDQMQRFFGQNLTEVDPTIYKENQLKVLRKARSPHLWLAPRSQSEAINSNEAETDRGVRAEFKSSWKSAISSFAKLFLAETPGMERDCFLAEHAGSAGRIARFQRALSQIKEDCLPKNITEESRPFTASIRRQKFLMDGFKCLMPLNQVDNHPYSSLNIRFEGEEGTGPGVNRGFFTGFSNALTGNGGNRHACFLYQPGQLPEQAGVFATRRPACNQPSEDVYKLVFTAIGRFIGLVLWFNQAVPITFTRPVLKFLLNREDEIKFEDLAYHNSTLYSSFCQMILDANSPSISEEDFESTYCCNFEFTVGEIVHELIPGGSKVKVTKGNAVELVRLSSLLVMLGSVRKDVESIRNGLHQIIPKKLLQPLNAEDFQLLLSGGVADIDLSRLKSIIRFNNSRSCTRDSLERFKGWFWSIVRDMTPRQRMKLLYFLTGSAVLPAYDNKVGNSEEISITIDIVSQSSASLPVASTCGQRLSMPLYESKKELRKKLLIAIECEAYGLG